jgi:hypothetical protein
MLAETTMPTNTVGAYNNIALALLAFHRSTMTAIGRGLFFITARRTFLSASTTTGGDRIDTNANWRVRSACISAITLCISRMKGMKLTHSATSLNESASSLARVHITGSTILGDLIAR